MNRNTILFLVPAALVVAVAVFGYQFYQDRTRPAVQINAGPGGLSVETK